MAAAALASLAIGGISQIAGLFGAAARARRERAAALDAFRVKVSDLGARRVEEADAAKLEVQQARQDALAQGSQASVSAAEGGVTGLSVEALQRAIDGDSAATAGIVNQNLALVNRQLDRERAGARAELQNRLNSIQGPSVLETALGIGRLAFNALNTGPQAPNVDNPDPSFTVGPLERIAPRTSGLSSLNIRRGPYNALS